MIRTAEKENCFLVEEIFILCRREEFHKHREVNMRILWKFRLQYGNESSVYFQSSALRFCGF